MAKSGKRDGFKIHCPQGLAGSNPAPGTLAARRLVVNGRYAAAHGQTSIHAHRRPYTSPPMRIEKSMSQIGDRLTKAKEDLRIIEEQLLFQMDVLEEAKTRMLVSETPLADQDYRIARDDFQRLQRSRDEAASRIAELQSEQDRLLDRMLNG